MFSLDYLVHAGALLFRMGFIVRDQLLLRGFIVIGTMLLRHLLSAPARAIMVRTFVE